MTSVKISYEKYRELHNLVSDSVLGTEIGAFDRMFKSTGKGPITTLGRCVELYFDSEEDAIWFKLKWL